MLRRLKAFLSVSLAFVMAIQILLATPALAGLSLCIEVDGPTGFEAEHDACCSPKAAVTPDVSFSREKGSCVSCIDVPFGDRTAGPQTSLGEKSFGAFFSAPNLLERIQPFKARPMAYLPLHFPAMSSMAAIQTIVLRV
jgi:hypothetical protein